MTTEQNQEPKGRPSPYAIRVKGVLIDPYRILLAYGITNPAQQHAIKKLLRAGKDHLAWHEDIQEAIDSLKRGLEIHQEDLPTLEDIQAIYKERELPEPPTDGKDGE